MTCDIRTCDRCGRTWISAVGGLDLWRWAWVCCICAPRDRVRGLRQSAGLSLGQAAKLMGVSRETIAGWEYGAKGKRYEEYAALLERLIREQAEG